MREVGDQHREAELGGPAVALEAAGRVGLCRTVVNDLPRQREMPPDGGVGRFRGEKKRSGNARFCKTVNRSGNSVEHKIGLGEEST